MQSSRKTIYSIFLGLLFLSLGGCGYHIENLTPTFSKQTAYYLKGQDKYTPLIQNIEQGFSRAGLKRLNQALGAAFELEIKNEKVHKRTLSLFDDGQVASYLVVYELEYVVYSSAGEKMQDDMVSFSRSFNDQPTEILGKTKEFEDVILKLRKQTIARLLQNISKIAHLTQG